jgi:hypothetical protein
MYYEKFVVSAGGYRLKGFVYRQNAIDFYNQLKDLIEAKRKSYGDSVFLQLRLYHKGQEIFNRCIQVLDEVGLNEKGDYFSIQYAEDKPTFEEEKIELGWTVYA